MEPRREYPSSRPRFRCDIRTVVSLFGVRNSRPSTGGNSRGRRRRIRRPAPGLDAPTCGGRRCDSQRLPRASAFGRSRCMRISFPAFVSTWAGARRRARDCRPERCKSNRRCDRYSRRCVIGTQCACSLARSRTDSSVSARPICPAGRRRTSARWARRSISSRGAVGVGRAFERVWLWAASLGLAFQPLAGSALLALEGYRDVRRQRAPPTRGRLERGCPPMPCRSWSSGLATRVRRWCGARGPRCASLIDPVRGDPPSARTSAAPQTKRPLWKGGSCQRGRGVTSSPALRTGPTRKPPVPHRAARGTPARGPRGA